MEPLPWDPIAEARRNWRESGFEAAADGMAAVTSVIRTHQILMARIEATLRPFGISFARYELLRLLAFTQNGSLPMSRARSLLQVHPASVTNVVDRLEADGLVERATHPDDRRSVILTITSAGSALVDDATVALNGEVFEQLGLAADEITTLGRTLAGFRERAGDFQTPRAAPDPL